MNETVFMPEGGIFPPLLQTVLPQVTPFETYIVHFVFKNLKSKFFLFSRFTSVKESGSALDKNLQVFT